MTEIPATRCLKILCKFSFVAKSHDVTNRLSNYKTYADFDKSYNKQYEGIWLQINSYDFSFKEDFLSFGLA